MTRALRFSVDGILLLDKPHGLTSNAALQKVKRLFQAKKAGHTGSLDPLATGMLPICFGQATKFSQYLLDSDKKYCVTMQFGVRTATGDAEGDVIMTRDVPSLTSSDIETMFSEFRGSISQIPSMYSALKYHGKPLYELARQGVTVERQSRVIQVYELTLQSFENHSATFFVHCSKGTYIRTLVDDIGEKLNCGAHVTQLRRLSVGRYAENQMITLDQLEKTVDNAGSSDLKKYLLSVDTVLNGWPQVVVTPTMAFYLKQGQSIMSSQAPKSGWVRLLQGEQLIGVGEMIHGKVVPRRLLK